jgi:sugar/nucleoside kinase (ribokinase family)
VSLRVKPGPNRLAVTGIGNAMLDIITQDSNETYRELGLVKAAMALIEEDQLDTFFNAMGPTIQMSGGSVANSIAGVAALGGTCGYIGKVANDDFGKRFTHDLRSLGVELDLAIAVDGEGVTGRCHVFISDDAQRDVPRCFQPAAGDGHPRTAHRSFRNHLRRGVPLRPTPSERSDS